MNKSPLFDVTRAWRLFPVALLLAVMCVPAMAACLPESDLFDTGPAPQAFWRALDPLGDCTLTLTGSQAEWSIPAGTVHNLWSGGANHAPRLLQSTPDGDFGIEVKFDSLPAAGFQMQGLIVQETDSKFVRVEAHHNGSGLRLFAAFIDGGSATAFHNAAPSGGVIPYFLRLERTGDNWTFSYSQDGLTWHTAVAFTQVLSVTESGFFAATYHSTPAAAPAFTARADYFDNLACPLGNPGVVTGGPEIEFWYGETQSFGELGNPQNWINILGRVSGPHAIASLSYTVNGGSSVPLAIGPNSTRLVGPGDFVTEIDYGTLNDGANSVEFTAIDSESNSTSVTVNVQYTAGQVWPLPYTADWSSMPDIQTVGKVVDGLWAQTAGGVRTTESGYDRLIVIGDETWIPNYEVVMPLTVHSAQSDAGVGFAVGWQGHTGSASPRLNWPLQSISWIRYPLSNPRLRIITYPNSILAEQPFPGFQAGVPYLLKSRSVSIGGGQSRVSMKLWPAADPEPADWMLETDTATRDGSVLLICHKADVTVGNVEITPVNPASFPQFISLPEQAAMAGTAYTYNVTVAGGTAPVVITASGLPGWLSLADHGDGTASLTGTPGPGDTGIHWVTLDALDAAGESASQSFWILVSPASTTCIPVSDNFAGDSAPKPFWRFLDPLGDGGVSVAGDLASISVPGGFTHDFWSSGIDVPRLLQAAPGGDFHVEVEFASLPAAQYQMQGIIVQATDDHALRFETFHNGSGWMLFVADVNAGASVVSVKHNTPAPFPPSHLQVQRVGNDWTFRVSEDGTNWVDAVTFPLAFPATEVGFYAGNAGPNPAFTATADYFMNVDCPDFIEPCDEFAAFTLDWSQYEELNPAPGEVYPRMTTVTGVDGSPVDVTVTVIRAPRDDNQVNTPGVTDFPGTVDVYTPTAETYRYWRPDDDQIDTLVFTFSEPVYLDRFMFGGQRPATTAHRGYGEITFWDGPDGSGSKVVSQLPNPGGIAYINTGDPLTAAINVLQDRGAQSTFLSTDQTYAMASRDPAYPPRPWTVLQLAGAQVRSITWSMYVSATDVSPDGDNSLDLSVPRAQTEPTGAISGYIGGFDFAVCADGLYTADVGLSKSVEALPVGSPDWDILISKGEQFVEGDYWLRLEYDEPSFDVWGPGNLKSGSHLDDDWHHIAGRFTLGSNTWGPHTMEILVDGDVVATRVANGTPAPSAASLFLGSYLGDRNYFGGSMDEVRFSRAARSDAWLQATHANIADPAGFVLVGAEETGTQPGFAFQRTLSVPGTEVTEPLAGLPVLINTAAAFLMEDVESASGDDLLFTDAAGNPLPHEIERFQQSAGRLVAWVQVPLLNSGAPTDFLLHYGNPSPPAPAFPPSAVWDADYVMVQHLNETGGTVADSTTYGNNGTVNGAAPTMFGIANGAFEFNGADNDIEIPDAPSLQLNSGDFTIEGWYARRAAPADGRFTITVTNHGPDPALDVVVLDELEPDFTLVQAEMTQGLYTVPPGEWHVGRLEPGASATLWIDFLRNQDHDLTNTARILSATSLDPVPDNDTSSVVVGNLTYTPAQPWMKPDFIVTEVVLTPAPGVTGALFNAYVTVMNQGDIPGDAGTIRAYLSEPSIVPAGTPGAADVSAGMLAVNEFRTLSFTGLAAPTDAGTHLFRAFVDAADATAEKSEGNNQKTATYAVNVTPPPPDPDPDPLPDPAYPSWFKPDFIVTEIVFNPTPNIRDATFRAQVTVLNQGDLPADGGRLRVWQSEPPPGATDAPGWDAEQLVGVLDVNETKTLTFSGLTATAPAGWHHFLARVNARGAADTDEKSFGNNHKSQVYQTYDVRLTAVPHPDGMELQWNSKWGLTYRVNRSTNIVDGFAPIATGILATPPTNTWIDVGAPTGGWLFYAISVE